MIDVKIEPGWKKLLSEEFQQPYFSELVAFVKDEYSRHTIYPGRSQIFSAFDRCPLAKVKVVIIGQDPYHGAGQAHGLSFSVPDGVVMPPSLQNIFKELQQDLGKPWPTSGNLERWASQGVLLLNATLTVRSGQPGSHQNRGWERFTDAVISRLSEKKSNLVFMLWGSYAQKKGALIDKTRHLVLESAHPSPFSVHRGFSGNRHFSKANSYLAAHGIPEVDW